MFCYIFCGSLLLAYILYVFLDLHYFLRALFTLIVARMIRKKTDVLNETRISGICLTNDLDHHLTHMNNAKFIRELDFAKMDFFQRTRLYDKVMKHGGKLALGATTIRYRKFIRLFNRYDITTKIIYWDDQNIYIEHRFITPSDDFINAIVLSKGRLINCDCTTDVIINELLCPQNIIENGKIPKPEMPLELSKWIESNEISSKFLRSL